uniref:Uncharacterized protein n=1 Tax=Oryza nivara TaxID=4536 RepID=A0A0E0J6B8_ORYNI
MVGGDVGGRRIGRKKRRLQWSSDRHPRHHLGGDARRAILLPSRCLLLLLFFPRVASSLPPLSPPVTSTAAPSSPPRRRRRPLPGEASGAARPALPSPSLSRAFWAQKSLNRSQRTPSPPNSESPPKANWGIASNNCYSRMIIASAALTSDRRMSNACDRMLAAVIPSPTAQPHAGHKGRDVCVLGCASPCPCPHLADATAMNAT